MKPTDRDLKNALVSLTLLKFFPAGDATMTMVAGILSSMVSTKKQLDWLIGTLVNQVGEWPGPAQVRALFCTQFAPADGIEGPPCSLAGFTPAEGERRSLELEAQRGVNLLPGEAPRRLPGKVEQVSESRGLDALVVNLANRKSMASTPRTRLADRKRVWEIMT
jgi:hypothetical protein